MKNILNFLIACSSPIISHLKLRALNMKIGTLIVLFIFGELRCQNGLIIKVLIIPYFSLLVANFQNWPSVFFPGREDFRGFLDISIMSINLFGNELHLFSPTQQSLQRHLNESNPTDQNLVEVSITYESDDTCYSIKRWEVHVECTCPPQEFANAPIEICLTLKLLLLCRFGLVSFAFDAKLTAMVAVEVTGRPQISFCLGCELSLDPLSTFYRQFSNGQTKFSK
ncbi:hypothetical protein CFP56_027508 [Quercus suber]|uniref:Uncharacterized protein n=1 Tax=Quercus suber TaxID=58331 RepID=A0AAW0JWK9_QUESU